MMTIADPWYDIADGVSIFEVKPFHLGNVPGDELAAVQFRFSEFFSSMDVPLRVLALSEPYSLQGAVDSHTRWCSPPPRPGAGRGSSSTGASWRSCAPSTDLHGIKYYLQPGSRREFPITRCRVWPREPS